MLVGKHKKLYFGGCNNREFLDDIQKADNDYKPHKYSEELVQIIFATIYYGWLVGKHGEDWKEHIYDN